MMAADLASLFGPDEPSQFCERPSKKERKLKREKHKIEDTHTVSLHMKKMQIHQPI